MQECIFDYIGPPKMSHTRQEKQVRDTTIFFSTKNVTRERKKKIEPLHIKTNVHEESIIVYDISPLKAVNSLLQQVTLILP